MARSNKKAHNKKILATRKKLITSPGVKVFRNKGKTAITAPPSGDK